MMNDTTPDDIALEKDTSPAVTDTTNPDSVRPLPTPDNGYNIQQNQKAELESCSTSLNGRIDQLPESDEHSVPSDKQACHDENGNPIVALVFSPDYVRSCNLLSKVRGRATLLQGLLEAYDLMSSMEIIVPKLCSKDDLLRFHSEAYIDCLKKVSNLDFDIEKYDEELESFGLCYDCPVFPGVYEYASLCAGGTILAAEQLNQEQSRIAINWLGGWHHAKRDQADGYCYINDAVLGVLKLREKFERVLYVDIDLHHGDGVEDAFCATAKVLTWSIHKLSPGFFPGTGHLSDVGFGRGKHYTLNTPLLDGIDDKTYFRVFNRIAAKIREQFDPKAIVLQFGADGLATDPCNSFNLTTEVYGKCLKVLLGWDLPTLILGGGGYNFADTAKCWTYLTGVILGRELDDEIPEHDLLMKYGPDYSLSVSAGNRANENTEETIDELLLETMENLDEILI